MYIITDKGIISQDTSLKRANDMVEVDNYLFAIGEGNFIDAFSIDMVNGSLNKVSSIVNENDKSDVMCISFSMAKTVFLCGHKSGSISAWSPDQQTILKMVGISKFHDAAINKIFFKETAVGNAFQQFVITGSSDNTLKVFNVDTFENIATKTLDAGVLDIFQSVDHEKTEYFIVSLDNGDLLGLNLGFEVVFKIPSLMGSKGRYVVNIPNPLHGEIEGDFLIVSDGNCINVNMWIKQGAINTILKGLSESQGGGQYRGSGGYRGGQGGYRGGRGDYRGGSGGKFFKRVGY